MWAQKKYLKSDHHIPPFCTEKLSSFVVIDCHRRELLELWYGVPALTEAKKVKPRGDNFFKFSPGFENAPLTIDRKYLHSRSCLVHIFHGSSWPLLQMHLLRLFSCRALSIGKTKKCSLFCKFVIQIGISPIIKFLNLNACLSLV